MLSINFLNQIEVIVEESLFEKQMYALTILGGDRLDTYRYDKEGILDHLDKLKDHYLDIHEELKLHRRHEELPDEEKEIEKFDNFVKQVSEMN